jgi:hypothetical protein
MNLRIYFVTLVITYITNGPSMQVAFAEHNKSPAFYCNHKNVSTQGKYDIRTESFFFFYDDDIMQLHGILLSLYTDAYLISRY